MAIKYESKCPETYNEVVAELESFGIMPNRMPSLFPMQQALEQTGLLSLIDPKRNVIIAGTNGKGTTAATLSCLLFEAGFSVGLYTSPHLIQTTERIRIDEKDLTKDQFVTLYLALRPHFLRLKLSHFEALTLMAAYAFWAKKPDRHKPLEFAIWEVGLGGLYDATNAIPHSLCGIATLGLDHTAILGNSLLEIAEQKFGIVSNHSTVLHLPLCEESSAVEQNRIQLLAQQIAQRTQSTWHEVKVEHSLKSIQSLCPDLPGNRAKQNTALALALAKQVFTQLQSDFSANQQAIALQKVRWPGRFSRFGLKRFRCPAFVSGDHNEQGIKSLLEILKERKKNSPWKTLHLILGVAQDKSIKPMFAIIFEAFSNNPESVAYYITETAFKPLPLDQYPEAVLNAATEKHANIEVLLEKIALKADPDDLIVVTGSLYLVGKVLETETLLKESL